MILLRFVIKRFYIKRFSTLSKMSQFCYREIMMKQFLKSVAAVNPSKLLSETLKTEKGNLHVCDKVYDITEKNVYLVGFGKAVLGMASQCERILGERLKSGVISVPHNIQNTFKNNLEFTLKNNSVIKVHEGAKNNLPDNNAEKGATEIINLVQKLNSNTDYLIILISGGGSALFPKPKNGILLEEKLKTINLLMTAGADICELNTVRKKLSLVKGGGLACLSHPVKSICLIISDVINDPLDVIASGPTVPNSDSQLAAFDIIQKYNLESKVPVRVLEETIKSSEVNSIIINKKFPHVDNFVIGNNQKALNAAKKYAEDSGFETVILSNQIEGLVQNVAQFYTNVIFEILNVLNKKTLTVEPSLFQDFKIESHIIDQINTIIKNPTTKSINLISGGETTVKVVGNGKGGRNQELALTLSAQIYDLKQKYTHLFDKYGVEFLTAGTDGIDGPTDAAGAIGDLCLVEKAKKLNLSVEDFLLRNDSYNFFSKIDNGSYLIKTGHTGTNVMDIHIIFIYEKQISQMG